MPQLFGDGDNWMHLGEGASCCPRVFRSPAGHARGRGLVGQYEATIFFLDSSTTQLSGRNGVIRSGRLARSFARSFLGDRFARLIRSVTLLATTFEFPRSCARPE